MILPILLRLQWKPLLDRLEINIPWFFAEPKYGVALLFVAFAGLQYLSFNGPGQSDAGIYTSPDSMAALEDGSSTNSVTYPSLPQDMRLFHSDADSRDVKFAGFVE